MPQPYQNLRGDSPIAGYEIGAGFIKVWFRDDPVPYRYRNLVSQLAALAERGKGLATFINRHKADLRPTRG